MTKEELALYEAPAISESISVPLLQTFISRYIAWKVNRKWKRFQMRKNREAFLAYYLK